MRSIDAARYLSGRPWAPARIGAIIAGLAVLTWALPPEATMGDLIRVIYPHGALVRAAEAALIAAGALGALQLLRGGGTLSRWTAALQRAGFLFWLLSFVISLFIMQAAWGGINWTEPRFIGTGRILAASAIAIAIGILIDSPRVPAITGVLLSAIVLAGAGTSGQALHPSNAIGGSSSVLLQIAYYAMVLLASVLALEVARLLAPGPRHLGTHLPSEVER